MEVIKRNKRSEKKRHMKRCVPDSPGKWGVAVNWRNAQMRQIIKKIEKNDVESGETR